MNDFLRDRLRLLFFRLAKPIIAIRKPNAAKVSILRMRPNFLHFRSASAELMHCKLELRSC